MRSLVRWLSTAAVAGLLAACGGTNFQPPGDAPNKWQEAMRKEAAGGWVVWGYGMGEASDSLVAGRSQADSRARSNLAARTDERLAYLREQLIERLEGESTKELEKTDIRAVLKRSGEIAANGASVDRRRRDDDGNWHALARTELRPALQEAAANRGLSPSAINRLLTEADGILAAPQEGGDG